MKTVSDKSKFIWNLIGCAMNALLSVILLLGVNRFAGEAAGGLFSFAFANAQVLQYIALFEVRPYQVTDVNGRYSFSGYYTLRLLSCAAMLLTGAGYILLSGFPAEKRIVVALLCLYKALEAFMDLFAAAYQQRDRVDLSGKNMAFRTMLVIAAFLITMGFTGKLVPSSVAMCLAVPVSAILFDYRVCRLFPDIRCRFSFSELKGIVIAVLPLAIAAFVRAYAINVPKYAIDRFLGDTVQNRFGILFMPSMVINLFSTFLFYPRLRRMAEEWNNGEISGLRRYIRRILLLLAGMTALCAAAAVWPGLPVLSLLYGVNLSADGVSIALLMVFGGLNAAEIFLYYVIVAVRKQYLPVIVYAVAAVLLTLVSGPLVRAREIPGAALSIVFAFLFIVLVYGGVLLAVFGRKGRKL